MNETAIIVSVVCAVVAFIVVERLWDRLPASHWVNQTRERFRAESGGDIGGDSWDGDCGD